MEFRGICGDAIRDASIAQVARFRAVTKQIGSNMKDRCGWGFGSRACADYLAALIVAISLRHDDEPTWDMNSHKHSLEGVRFRYSE